MGSVLERQIGPPQSIFYLLFSLLQTRMTIETKSIIITVNIGSSQPLGTTYNPAQKPYRNYQQY